MSEPWHIESILVLAGAAALMVRGPAGASAGDMSAIMDCGEVRSTVPFDQWLSASLDTAQSNLSASRQPGRKDDAATPSRARKAASPIKQSGFESAPNRLFAVPIPQKLASSVKAGQLIDVELRDANGPQVQKRVCVGTPNIQELVASGQVGMLAQILERAGQHRQAAILKGSIACEPLKIPEEFWIEHLVSAGTGLVVKGWMANLADRAVHVVTGDLRSWLFSPALERHARTDVHAHLQNLGALTSASDEHGFTFVMPTDGSERQDLYFVETSPDGSRTTFHGPLEKVAQKDERLAFDIIRSTFGDIRSLDADGIDAFYRPALSTRKGAMAAQKFSFGPAPHQGRPLTSIIIPFYGDAFFLNCVHHLQRVLDDSFELVLVVDDSRIWPEIYSGLALRSESIRLPTQLLQNLGNYGFGGANNIGATAARGDVLLLMNSDILVMNAQPLKGAAEAIRERRQSGRPEGLIGFSLLYEDNTIQHIGMEFRRSSFMNGLFVADHPMKGLPFGLYSGETIRKVPAVTAALLALSAEFYAELDGFDLAYERGDFEDADLCLRARRAGADIEIHVHPGLYHLERQSIPRMGDTDVRAMVTYMNCAEFNRRWTMDLDPPKRVFRVGSRTPA